MADFPTVRRAASHLDRVPRGANVWPETEWGVARKIRENRTPITRRRRSLVTNP